MSAADALGTAGVALLLVAFAASAFGRLASDSRPYHLLNATGAALACWASLLLPFWPFAVLEGTWCAVALAALARGPARRG